ncbi:MAG: TIM-barrel domain-containing protein [Promethearchaeota archaeon]
MITKQEKGISLQIKEGFLQINVIDENIIQVLFSINKKPKLGKSLSIIDFKNPSIKFELIEQKNTSILKTTKITIQINNETGVLEYSDPSDSKILKENGRELIENLEENAFTIKQKFNWDENEALYGLGQHQDVENKINYRGLEVALYQGNLKASVPVLISSKGYGILWDNYSFTKFCDTENGSYLWSEVGDEINYYFIFGPELDQIVKGIRFLTGKCPMLPKWAFGYVQCKERYKNAEEIVGIVEEYRKRNIPLDLVVQDWRYWGSLLKWGDKQFTKKRFSNPAQMIERIHNLNAKIMISIWPTMSRITSDYKEMKKHGYLYKGRFVKVYDAFNEDARNLYWKQANEGLFKYGIDAWWCDSTEPVEISLVKASTSKEEFCKRTLKKMKTRMTPAIGSAARYLNAYSLMQSKGMYENQRKTTSEKRVVNLTRSGFTGQQRFSTIVWSGDISARWDVFAAQIPAGLNFCMTGIPYWTTDIGAFFTKSNKFLYNMKANFPKGIKDMGYREFYTRWFQFGAFSPMFRSHGTNTPREVWRFGEPGTMFYDTLIKFITLRYKLLSYIYSLAGMVTNQAYTMMRSLVFDFRNDPDVYDINDEYMFGPAFLVCPVLEPMYYRPKSKVIRNKEKTRTVYLPKDSRWFDFWTGIQYEGGKTIEAKAPIDILPLYIKAGSIIPFNSEMQCTTEKPSDPLELRIYQGADAEFFLYEDENDNYNYEQGNYSTIKIEWMDNEKKLIINSRQKEFPGMLKTRTFNILFVSGDKGARLEETKNYDDIIEYSGDKIERTY